MFPIRAMAVVAGGVISDWRQIISELFCIFYGKGGGAGKGKLE